jgi:hypothetical protein
VIGRLLDLSHISWQTCVADLLSDHMRGACSGAALSSVVSGGRQLQQVHAVMWAHCGGGGLAEGVQDADGVGLDAHLPRGICDKG